jgi:hypothetical protein
MNKKIKLDLHTHPIEALKEKMGISGILDINQEVVLTIVKAVKSAGLDGIAITERNNFNQGWVFGLEFTEQFNQEDLLILPGVEMDYRGQQYLSIYIPERCRRKIPLFRGKEWFLILAHPGFYHPLDMRKQIEIDIDAVEGGSIHGDFAFAGTISQQKNIPIIKSSDALKLEDIGRNYTEVEIT